MWSQSTEGGVMKWQVFVRAGITNTSAETNNVTNRDAVAVTNAIRSDLEGAKLKKKATRKTATYLGEVTSTDDVTKVATALASMLKRLAELEGSDKAARLDNVWLLINREAESVEATPRAEDEEEPAAEEAGDELDDSITS